MDGEINLGALKLLLAGISSFFIGHSLVGSDNGYVSNFGWLLFVIGIVITYIFVLVSGGPGEYSSPDNSDVTSTTEKMSDGMYKTTISGKNYGTDIRFSRDHQKSQEEASRMYEHSTRDR